jgi:hypothetical protein
MQGYSIIYKPKDSNAKVLFHHTLFGRLVSRNIRGRKSLYYVPGMLHTVKFARIADSNIFVENIDKLDVDLLNIFGELNIKPEAIEESTITLLTGREYWLKKGNERGLPINERKPRRTR